MKLQLSRFSCVSRAVEVAKRAKQAKWPVAVLSANSPAAGVESPDTFLADFAVGIAAGQFLMGGIYSAECVAKYNRMMEIADENPAIRFVGGRFRK